MIAKDVITLARKHVTEDSSARLCLDDAIALYDAGFLTEAKRRALDSLAYSVGRFSSIYKRASINSESKS